MKTKQTDTKLLIKFKIIASTLANTKLQEEGNLFLTEVQQTEDGDSTQTKKKTEDTKTIPKRGPKLNNPTAKTNRYKDQIKRGKKSAQKL